MIQVIKHNGWFREGQLAFLFTLSHNRTTKGFLFSWGNKKAAHLKQMKGNFTAYNELQTLWLQIAKEDHQSN